MKKHFTFLLIVAMAVLAAMGCWFCWHCPSRFYEAQGLFWRQVAGNVLGIALFAGVVALGWRRCIKTAPWLMVIWLLAFVTAYCGRPINGVHRWLVLDGVFPQPFAMIHINVVTCIIPVFALFVAWLHERRWMRRWMEWGILAALVVGAVCYVAGSESRMMRIMEFLHPSTETIRYSYMGEQLQSAVSVADWFGNAGRKLYLLPCPESDGMMAAAALLFGKWFPAMVCVLFGFVGAVLAMFWRGETDVSKRRYLLLFAVWLFVPAAYCYFQSLGMLPVAGFSPALVGAGGTAVVMAWFGFGLMVAAFSERDESRPSRRRVRDNVPCLIVVGFTMFAGSAIVWGPGENRKFYEKLPVKGESDPFAKIPKRGTIVAADGSILACPARKWSFHLDPMFPIDKDTVRSCAKELATVFEIPQERLLMDFMRTDLRYIPLKDVDVDGIVDLWYRDRGWQLKRCGLIREPMQDRFASLGDAALPVVGTIHRVLPGKEPDGASGLEYLFNKGLKGEGNVPGAIVHTTIVPTLQKKVDAILVDACITNKATAAWSVVLKIPSGEIAAMTSVRGGTNGVVHTSYNGTAHCNFEPGGLIKPLTYAIALNEGVLKEDAKLDQGEGTWECNGKTIGDDVKGMVTIPAALSNRVNIAACKTALEIGADRFHGCLTRLGFGSKVSGRTVPGEEAGIIADAERWDVMTRAYVGMGYGIAVTGLQVAQAYATLANHGRLVEPRLVTKVVNGKSGNMVKDFVPATNESKQVLLSFASDAIAYMLGDGLSTTIQMIEGGKYSSTNFMSACAGVFPCDKPRYVVLVALENVNKSHADKLPAKSVWDDVLRCIQ